MEVVQIPSKALATLIESALRENGVKYEIIWEEFQALISINKSDSESLLDLEKEYMKHGNVSQTVPLHCAYIPLLKEVLTLNLIDYLEKCYNVKITLTECFLNPLRIAYALNDCGHFFTRQHVSSILAPRDTTTSKPPVWYCSNDISFKEVDKLSTGDSIQMEDMLQYGGLSITFLGEDYMVDFKRMKMKSISGKILYLQRQPTLNKVLYHHQMIVNIHALSLASSMESMHQACLVLLNKMLVRKNFNWSCPSKFRLDMQQQIENFVKQFCVFFEFTATDQVSSVTLEGAPGYVEIVHEIVSNQVCHLEAYFSSSEAASLPPMQLSYHQICFEPPHFWVPQDEKCIFCEVSQGSPEWNFVLALARASMPDVSLHAVERIQNTVLWERYCLERKHMCTRNHGETNEMFLFHGTSQTDPYMIAKGDFGVDFRFSKTNRPTLMWGTGAYFADRLKYSDSYAFKIFGGKRIVMLVSVLTGNSYYYGTDKNSSLTKPPSYNTPTGTQEYDTVSGRTHNTTVYTVYDHCKACPAYMITY